MTKTLNYGVDRSSDLALLTTLIVGFMAWDMLSVHFSIIVFAFGMNYTFISAPRYQNKIDSHVNKFEERAEFITGNRTWKTVRPLIYLGLTIAISLLAYLVAV